MLLPDLFVSFLLPLAILAQQAVLAKRNRTSYFPAHSAIDIELGTCAPLTVIYARGTNEPGNIGSVIGPRMFWTFSNALNGNIALQGVSYPADSEGNVVRGAKGAPEMTRMVKLAKEQCSESKVALIGYSQGAFVTHYTLNQDPPLSELVDAVVVFGDPELPTNGTFGNVSSDKIKSYCNEDDQVCTAGVGNITDGHKAYMISDAIEAVSFVLNVTGLDS
ncbi:Cutinase [Pseudocercospora fuligena]|uniref:cutinase n=1 Tax=Pseudocercospora fuligena TaxID=685502 RepID=A0A8H6RIY4_9PEZI|nr:Cutinase [Pseudocercospora fuligena]